MRKKRKLTFNELVLENKLQILKDQEILERIEKKIEEKYTAKAK